MMHIYLPLYIKLRREATSSVERSGKMISSVATSDIMYVSMISPKAAKTALWHFSWIPSEEVTVKLQ